MRRSSLFVIVCLLFEITVLDHPRELDDAFQLQLAQRRGPLGA